MHLVGLYPLGISLSKFEGKMKSPWWPRVWRELVKWQKNSLRGHLEIPARGCSFNDKIHHMMWSCSLLKWISRHAIGFSYGDKIRKISTFQIEEKCYCLSVELAVWKYHFQMPTISCMWRNKLIWRHGDVIWLYIYPFMVLYFLL